ncbi:MAG: MFS transporter [Betaproteobacteria bacterium]|nr:MFS transporter [Betaproteobacteria bacterium]
MVAFGAIMMMLDGYDLSAMGLAVPAIAEAWAIEPSSFRWALSASLMGVGVGSLLAGLCGDRWGRRATLTGMFGFGAMACLGTVFATNVNELVFWRFLVGIGMGGAIPNIIALVSELMPAKRRPLMIVLVYSGAAVGGGLGSLLASVIVPLYGWQSVFMVGGILPLVVALFVFKALPESPAFLIANGRRDPQASATILRLRPDFPKDQTERLSFVDSGLGLRPGVGALFGKNLGIATLLFWTLFICTQAMVFFIQSWYPTLLTRNGYDIETALQIFSLWDFGALTGGIVVAGLASHFKLEKLLSFAYLLAALCLGMLSLDIQNTTVTQILTFATGFSVVGASFCMGALAAGFYPSEIRATGVGWGLGVGRVGSISSPLIGGAVLAAGWTNSEIFTTAMLPALIASISVFALSLLIQKRSKNNESI